MKLRRVARRGLVDEVLAAAAKLPIRDQATLSAQFAGRSPDEVADALIRGAARATGAVGAMVGVWAVLPIVPAFPVEVAAETLTVVGIEIKLVAELHEVYGMGVTGPMDNRRRPGARRDCPGHRLAVAQAPGPQAHPPGWTQRSLPGPAAHRGGSRSVVQPARDPPTEPRGPDRPSKRPAGPAQVEPGRPKSGRSAR